MGSSPHNQRGIIMSKRARAIAQYRQDLNDANHTRNQVLQGSLTAQLRGNRESMKLHFLLLSNIETLIEKLRENTLALLSNEKVYICEWCGNDTRTLYDVNNRQLCVDCEIEANE